MTMTRRWAIGTAIAAVVILAAGWFLLVKPQNSKVSDLHTQTAAQDQQNQVLTTQIEALEAEQKQLPQQQRILEKFATKIPDTAAEPGLIRALSATAKASGVDITAITPGAATQLGSAAGGAATLGAAPASSASLYSLPLSLTVTGSYANLESFFSGLEQLPRAFMVSGFSLSRAGSTAGSSAGGAALAPNALAASISTEVFYATGTAPIQPATPQTATTPGGTATNTPAPASTDATNPAAGEAS
jgi:Tfp pilus assembly protein PilO